MDDLELLREVYDKKKIYQYKSEDIHLIHMDSRIEEYMVVIKQRKTLTSRRSGYRKG